MDNETFLLFVYGTLMRDGSRNRAISSQTFIREAKTKTGYQLLDLGSYPGLVRVEQDGRQVMGELWEINKSLMPMLDRIEGAPNLYRMEKVEIENEEKEVYSYFFKLKTDNKKTPVIENNCWVNQDGSGI
jgi:gamma-glutamylaminecyclotransferase